MPNFWTVPHGLVTRIGIRPSQRPVLHRVELDGLFIEAVPLKFDRARWHREFLSQWPPGSAAWLSYWDRIVAGPEYSLARAYPLTEGKDEGCREML